MGAYRGESPVIFHNQGVPNEAANALTYQPMQGNDYGYQNSYPMNGVPTPGLILNNEENMALLKSGIRMAEAEQKHEQNMKEIAQKAYLKEWNEEQKLVRKQRKAMEQKAVYKDPNGYLRIQSMIPGKKPVVSDPIFPSRNVRLEKIVSSEPISEIQMLCVEGMQECIYLIGKECSARGFMKALEKAGLSINFGRDKNRQIADMVYAYLLKNPVERYLKRRYGWNKTTFGCGWEFADDTEETVQSILEKKERN